MAAVLSRLFRRRPVVGIDIGDQLVRVVEVKASALSQIEILGVGELPTPPGSFSGGLMRDPARLAEAISTAISQAGIRSRQAAVAIDPQVAFLRKLRFPVMPAQELRKTIALQPGRYIPIAREAVQFDTAILPCEKDAPEMCVVVAAAPEQAVADHMEVCRLAGLKPILVDLEPLALYRAAVACQLAGPDLVVGILDIGCQQARLSLFDGDVPVASRVLLLPQEEGQPPLSGQESPELFLEIRRSLEFLLTQLGRPPVRLILTGQTTTDPYMALSLTAYLRGFMGQRLPSDFGVEPIRHPSLLLPPSHMLAFGLSLRQELFDD